jgi:hypothetical protein
MFVAYLALGCLVLLGVLAALRGYAYANPARLTTAVRRTAIGAALLGAVLLLLRVPLGVLFLLIGIALPLVLRWRALWNQQKARSGPRRGNASRADTRYLSLVLDHATGTVDGSVLAGRHRGRRLAELAIEQLLEVRDECLADDPDGVPLIEAYLDRIHGTAWRRQDESRRAAEGDGAGRASAAMTRDEAYEILGLAAGASEAEIREAHHRLMMKLHPDRGGSNYLAAKINQAKDLLLGA